MLTINPSPPLLRCNKSVLAEVFIDVWLYGSQFARSNGDNQRDALSTIVGDPQHQLCLVRYALKESERGCVHFIPGTLMRHIVKKYIFCSTFVGLSNRDIRHSNPSHLSQWLAMFLFGSTGLSTSNNSKCINFFNYKVWVLRSKTNILRNKIPQYFQSIPQLKAVYMRVAGFLNLRSAIKFQLAGELKYCLRLVLAPIFRLWGQIAGESMRIFTQWGDGNDKSKAAFLLPSGEFALSSEFSDLVSLVLFLCSSPKDLISLYSLDHKP